MRAEFEPQKLRGAFCGNAEFTAFAMDLAVQSSDDIGRLGALAFLVVAMGCGGSSQRLTRSQEGDPVGAAMSYWKVDRPMGDILKTLRDAHERMYARGATDDVTPGTGTEPGAPPPAVARLLAVFNPYAAPVLNLSISHHYQWIPGAAEASDAKLVAARALMPWPASPAPSTGREHPVAGLARLGLFAEWAQAAAFFHNDPDVRLIGRSAEAWRRTAAGQWRYGTPPEGWVGSPEVDASMAHRLAALAMRLILWKPPCSSSACGRPIRAPTASASGPICVVATRAYSPSGLRRQATIPQPTRPPCSGGEFPRPSFRRRQS